MTYVEPLARMAVVKRHTRGAHLETEKIFIPQLKNIHSKEGYVQVLKLFYGFYSPLYNTIFSFIDEHLLPDKEERRNAEWISRDLAAMNDHAAMSGCTDLPQVANYAQAFGALYVLEGSTLGGEIIVEMLRKNIHLNLPDDAFSFFSAYREKNLAMWRSFGDYFEEAITTDEALQQAVNAANETFAKLKWWILNRS